MRDGIGNTFNSAVDNLKTSSNEAREKINGILKKRNKEELVEDGFSDIDASEIE
jgi:aminoglycoside phosphotransferase family enzyme